MFNKKIIAAAVCAALIPLAAIAGPGGGPGGHHHGRHGGLGFLQGVTLTPDQQNQIHQIMQTNWTQAKPLVQQLRADHKQIEDLLAGGGAVTAAQLTPIQQQESQILQQLASQRLATALQVRALLSPAQLAQSAQAHQQLQSLRQQERAVFQASHPGATPAQ